MIGTPFFYVMIILLIGNIIITFILGMGCCKAGSSSLKKDLNDFQTGCTGMINHLDKFQAGLNQFPATFSEDVKPLISEYISEQVELTIKEFLENLGREVESEGASVERTDEEMGFSTEQCYKDYFLVEPCCPFLSKEGKQVTIRDSYHKIISALVNISDGECRNIYHYVDNVLRNHFLAYEDTIRFILSSANEKTEGV